MTRCVEGAGRARCVRGVWMPSLGVLSPAGALDPPQHLCLDMVVLVVVALDAGPKAALCPVSCSSLRSWRQCPQTGLAHSRLAVGRQTWCVNGEVGRGLPEGLGGELGPPQALLTGWGVGRLLLPLPGMRADGDAGCGVFLAQCGRRRVRGGSWESAASARSQGGSGA